MKQLNCVTQVKGHSTHPLWKGDKHGSLFSTDDNNWASNRGHNSSELGRSSPTLL